MSKNYIPQTYTPDTSSLAPPSVPNWSQATPDLSASDAVYDSSSSSSATFGIVVGVLVGVLALFFLLVIWHKYLKKKLEDSKC
ncbi:hypothetical protein HN51_070164 [Arachis hypogaea]